MNFLVPYNKTFDSCYHVFFRKDCTADVAKNPVSCEFVQVAAKSSYPCYVLATKQMGSFLKALRHVKKMNEEAASRDSPSARNAFGSSHLDNAVLFGAEEHDV